MEGRILVVLCPNGSSCNMQVVVGVRVQLTFGGIVREFDIFPPVAPDKAIIGRGVCAAVTMNISNALLTLTLLGIREDTDDGWVFGIG